MTKKKGKKNLNKEIHSEDWCFKCKEGGDLLICDYGDCLKTYHAVCIEGDKSFVESGSRWTCDRHFCFICKKRSKFCCVSCPKAVCQLCYEISEFQMVKGKKGICNHCLKLARLGEENKDVDSDGEKVDFSDLRTYEGLFLDYWRKAIKKQEGLSLEHLQSVDAQLRKRSSMSVSDPTDILEEETDSTSDFDDDDGLEKLKERRGVSKKKRYKEQKFVKDKSCKREFIDWGSKSLILFLQSVGEDTSKKLSELEVSAIVNRYINENKLFDPNKKKKIMCDERLNRLLGKKSLNRNRIHDMLGSHFLENQHLYDEVDLGYSTENRLLGNDFLVPCKKQKRMSTCKMPVEKEATTDFSGRSLAAIIPENIKLIYLKRSLVEELLKKPEEFEKKVTGSLVRVKSDPYDYLQQNSHQLVQVRGVKKKSAAGNITEVHLEVSNMLKDIHIRLLSEDSFTEEECEDLRKRVKDGLLGNPTVDELEEKARSLHEDITKHWIITELVLLQHKIDQANEKGWRRELSEYLERRELLQTSSEQSRLLQQYPKVIASLADPEPSIGVTSVFEEKVKSQVTSGTVQSPEKELNPRKEENPKVLPPQLINLGSNGHDIAAETLKEGKKEDNYSTQQPMQQDLSRKENCQTSTIDRSMIQSPITFEAEQTTPEGRQQLKSHDATEKVFKVEKVQNQKTSSSLNHLIELSSDDDDDNGDRKGAVTSKQEIKEEKEAVLFMEEEIKEEDQKVWYCIGPEGDEKGPLSMSVMRRWTELSCYALKYNVWKSGHGKESAIPISDAVNR